MTIEYGQALLTAFTHTAKQNGDPFFVAHFSRAEDKFQGQHDGMDAFDAMILIKQLVKDFKIDAVLLNTAL